MHDDVETVVRCSRVPGDPARRRRLAQVPATPPQRTRERRSGSDPLLVAHEHGAVRVGEPFDLSLTCAVLENDAVQVVPDESRLGNAVIQMAPFEVVGGTHPADLHSANRRFFQYRYRLRIINPDAIGKDVPIPVLTIHYRVNSRVAANTALQGRDLVYVLPPQSVRVTSVVPADAPDIRDAAGERLRGVEALEFRAGVLEIVGIALVALGALMILLVLVAPRPRQPRSGRRRIGVSSTRARSPAWPRVSSRRRSGSASSRAGRPVLIDAPSRRRASRRHALSAGR